MKKIAFILIMFVTLIVGAIVVNAGTGNERRWFFMEDKFSGVPISELSADTTVDGLTMSKGIKVCYVEKNIRGVYFKKVLHTINNGSKSNGYVKFYVNGNTDIHLLAGLDSEQGNGTARNLTIYSEGNNQTVNIPVQKINDYKYEYRGGAGYVYLYTPGGYLRIFGISAKDYVADEYESLGDNEKIKWNFTDYTNTYSTINANTNINGMMAYATETYPLEIKSHYIKSAYGVARQGYMNLKGTGKYDGRFISFSVPKNSDIYVTARSGDGASQRKLIVRNTYFGMPNTDIEKSSGISDYLEDTYLNISGELSTQKISYYGSGEEFVLCSADSAIRIHSITVVPRVDTVVNSKTWNISNNNAFVVGESNKIIDGLTLLPGVNISQCNTSGYTKMLAIRSGISGDINKVKFNVSDSSGTRGQNAKRTISVKANTNLVGAMLVVINSEDYLIGCADLSTDIKEYKFDYTGYYDEISVYAYYPNNERTAYMYIYSIDNGIGITVPNDTQRSVSVVAGQSYQYYFTAENVNADGLTYKITYNPNALKLKYAGYGDGSDNYSKEGLNIIKNDSGTGEIIYTIDKAYEKWTGVTISVIFEAKTTGNTTIAYAAEINN